MSTSEQLMSDQQFSYVLDKILPDVLSGQTAFFEAFGQILETDAISMNDQAFLLKHCPQPVTVNYGVQGYNTDENVVFGENNTAPYNRFGKLVEVKYTNIPVKYAWNFTVREGFDRATINANFDKAVAERTILISEAIQEQISTGFGESLGEAASELTTSKSGEQGYTDLFDKAYVQLKELGVRNRWRAYVTPEVFANLVNLGLTTTAKGATTINIENQELVAYKGFILQVVPSHLMSGVKIIFAPDGVGIGFMGLETFRAIESHDFNGKELQFAAKGGCYISDENKRAIFKVNELPTEPESVLSV